MFCPLDRLLSTPYVRTKLGLDLEKGTGLLVTHFDEHDEIAIGLSKVVSDIATNEIKVGDFYTVQDRKTYVDDLHTSELPNTGKRKSIGLSLDDITKIAQKPESKRAPKKKM